MNARTLPGMPHRPGWRTRATRVLRDSALGRRIDMAIFQPRGPEAEEVRLKQRRVFILPTRAGLTLGAMLIVMQLGSINYLLGLGHALTFLIAGIALVGMLHTFRNLAFLFLRPARVEPVFAGEIADFRVVLANRDKFDRYAIALQADDGLSEIVVDVPGLCETTVAVPVLAQRRGWLQMPRITLRTIFPFGIWRAWAYWQPDLRCLVYPHPAPPGEPLPAMSAGSGAGDGRATRGSEDFAGIRNYIQGDPIKHLAWKAMARSASDAPLTKTFEGGQQGELWLDLVELRGRDTEAALSQLTRWVLDCETLDFNYGLRLPGSRIEPGHGPAHRDRCLQTLAVFGI